MFEARHVDIDGPGPEGDGSTFLLERVIRQQRLADREDRLAQAGPRLGVWHVTPQEGGQPVPGMGLAGRYRQIGEKRLRLLRWPAQGGARWQPRPEATEERDLQECHAWLGATRSDHITWTAHRRARPLGTVIRFPALTGRPGRAHATLSRHGEPER